MKKSILILVLKVIIYACTLALGILGVTSLTSCTASRSVDINGRATVVTVDTTVINHNGNLIFKSRH